MFRRRFFTFMGFSAVLVFLGTAYAVPITPTISFDPGTPYTTTGLTDASTSGSNMAGMEVTAYFDNNSSESATWVATNDTGGAAAGTNWSLGVTGETTFINPFTMTLSLAQEIVLTRLVIDGRPGDTVFDVISGDNLTPESYNGRVISFVYGPEELNITATYRNEVALNNVLYGDLYTLLDLSFSGANGGLQGGNSLYFIADTDNTAIAGDLKLATAPEPVPEPSTLFLLGSGLAWLGLYARKRKKA